MGRIPTHFDIMLYLIFLLFSERCTAGIALRLLVSPSRRWYRPPVAGIALLLWTPAAPPRPSASGGAAGVLGDKCDTTLQGV